MKLSIKTLVSLSACVALTAACSKPAPESKQEASSAYNIDIWPRLDIAVKADPAVEAKLQALVSNMTLEQKIAQMIQPEIRDITVEDMRKYGFGSYLNGGGSFPNGNKHATPQDWIALAESMYQASIDDSLDGSSIPTMWGTDAVHGHNNVVGATIFPHNIGLGAMNNPALMQKIAEATATEVMVTGIDWVFAPTVAVVRDDRWGRTYESYSEDPNIVEKYSAAIVKGLQGEVGSDFLSDKHVISTVKHFIGDGGTENGDDQGDTKLSEQELFDIHAAGYVGGLSVGAQSVMASFNSWHGEKLHGKKYLLTDVLKEKMGFDGFVVGDWNGHGQIKGCTNDNCPQAVNAGLDVFMAPTPSWKPLYYNTLQQVKEGIIPLSRIDDAVTRILRVKIRAGLFAKASPAKRALSGKTALIGQHANREIARQAVRESLVLLKNNNATLPIDPSRKILVAGDAADNIGKQSGGWTITWQGTNNTNEDFPGGSSILDGIQQQVDAAGGKLIFDTEGRYEVKPDVAIVVFGEEPYAEGHGDRATLDYQSPKDKDLILLQRLQQADIPVVSIFISGRAMWTNPELNASEAFIAAWLPGSEGIAVADLLFTDANGKVKHDFTGRLPFSWPNKANQYALNPYHDDYQPLFELGYGLSLGDDKAVPILSEESGLEVDGADSLAIFDNGIQHTWQMLLQNENTQSQIVSNTATIANLSYRTIDKDLQEDALRLIFDDTQQASFVIASKNYFREDLSAWEQSAAHLKFTFAQQSSAEMTASINMSCEAEADPADTCSYAMDISEELKSQTANAWASMQIPLTCFTDRGVDLANLVIPFQLSVSGTLRLDISDISIGPKDQKAQTLGCE